MTRTWIVRPYTKRSHIMRIMSFWNWISDGQLWWHCLGECGGVAVLHSRISNRYDLYWPRISWNVTEVPSGLVATSNYSDPQTLRTVQFSAGGSFQKIPERWTTPDVFVKSFVFGVSLGFLKLPLFTFDTVGAKRMYRKECPKIWTCSDYVSCVVSWLIACVDLWWQPCMIHLLLLFSYLFSSLS